MYDKGMTAQGYRYQGIANLNVLSMITLFGKLKELHEITRFKSNEEEGKLKDKKLVVFKASSSKASSSIIGEGDSGGESPNEEDMYSL